MYKKNNLSCTFDCPLGVKLRCGSSIKVESQGTFNIQERKYEFYEKIGLSSLRGSLIERLKNV